MEPWDVTIVGGGVLGTSVAYHLAEAGSLSALDFWERRAWVPPPSTRLPIPSAAS